MCSETVSSKWNKLKLKDTEDNIIVIEAFFSVILIDV